MEVIERENAKVVAQCGFSPGNILFEDLAALSAGHVTKMATLIKTISASDEQRYPESVRKIYIVNPPGVFALAMGVVRPWLDERTLQKFAPGTSSDFIKEWKEVVGEENLPGYLGGASDYCTPPGGNVKKLLEAKGIRPEKLTVSRRGEHYLEITASKNQIIHVQIIMKRLDIGCGIYFKNGDKKESVLATKKYDSDTAPHLITHVAQEDGTYLVHLDNTDSHLMTRKLKFLHWVKDPFVPKPKEEKGTETREKKKKSKSSKTSTTSDKSGKREKKKKVDG
jgi:hypothetical protein